MLLRTKFSNINRVNLTSYRFLSKLQTNSLTLALSNPVYKPNYNLINYTLDQNSDNNSIDLERLDSKLIMTNIKKNRNNMHQVIDMYDKLVANAKVIVKTEEAVVDPELFTNIDKQICQLKKDLVYNSSVTNETSKKDYLIMLDNELSNTKCNMYNNYSELSTVIDNIKYDDVSDKIMFRECYIFLCKIATVICVIIGISVCAAIIEYLVNLFKSSE